MKIRTATFFCARCGGQATRIELMPAGVVHPKADSKAIEDLGVYKSITSDEGHAMIVDSVVCKSRGKVDDSTLKNLEALITKEDSESLYRMDPEYVPSYCQPCQKHYCRKHWKIKTVMDHDFYDCTLGICPKGHRRTLDD